MSHFQVNAYKSAGAQYTEGGALEDQMVRVKLMRGYVGEALDACRGTPKLLDVGCADGGICAPFRDRAQLHGLDVNEKFIVKARENGFNAHVVDFERERYPFADETFDVVVSGETIEHVVNTDWFMTEINRVLKPGGAAVFSIPNVNQWISIPMMLVFDLPPRAAARFRAPHVRDFTPRTMKKCLHAFGFEITKSAGTGYFVPGLSRPIGVSLTRVFKRFAAEVVFLVRKKRRVEYREELAIDFG
jgi:2-polyprenyl-3-methyl-5-hydroxy-6-metoxy-1,4-benzoquinol methylase